MGATTEGMVRLILLSVKMTLNGSINVLLHFYYIDSSVFLEVARRGAIAPPPKSATATGSLAQLTDSVNFIIILASSHL